MWICPNGKVNRNGVCVHQCGANQTLQNGKCVNKTPRYGANQILQNGRCVKLFFNFILYKPIFIFFIYF